MSIDQLIKANGPVITLERDRENEKVHLEVVLFWLIFLIIRYKIIALRSDLVLIIKTN